MAEEQNTQQATGIKNAELFDNVLDKNEQVLRVIKPNKLKLFVYWFLSAFWINVWIAIVAILPFCFEEGFPWEYYLIPVGIIVLVFIVTGILAEIYYRNNYFAYTNSRILIRSGIIGIDFKSLARVLVKTLITQRSRRTSFSGSTSSTTSNRMTLCRKS